MSILLFTISEEFNNKSFSQQAQREELCEENLNLRHAPPQHN